MLGDLVAWLADAAFFAYLLVFIIGLAWILVGLLLGGLESMAEMAHDVAAEAGSGDSWGHQQVGLSPFSPLMLAVFGMVFGVTGMTLEMFSQLTSLWGLAVTIGTSILIGFLLFLGLQKFFVAAQATSLPSAADAVGTHATVATRIAPGKPGTINFELAGRRQSAGARLPGKATAEPGEVVRIQSLRGGVALVSKES